MSETNAVTREQAAEVMRKYAGHLMNTMAEALPPDRLPPLTPDEWHTVERALSDVGISVDRVTADIARAITADDITRWMGGPDA